MGKEIHFGFQPVDRMLLYGVIAAVPETRDPQKKSRRDLFRILRDRRMWQNEVRRFRIAAQHPYAADFDLIDGLRSGGHSRKDRKRRSLRNWWAQEQGSRASRRPPSPQSVNEAPRIPRSLRQPTRPVIGAGPAEPG